MLGISFDQGFDERGLADLIATLKRATGDANGNKPQEVQRQRR